MEMRDRRIDLTEELRVSFSVATAPRAARKDFVEALPQGDQCARNDEGETRKCARCSSDFVVKANLSDVRSCKHLDRRFPKDRTVGSERLQISLGTTAKRTQQCWPA